MTNSSAKGPRIVFYIIAVFLPVFILLLLESALRLADYGRVYPLFVQAKGIPDYLTPNPELIKRYFHRPELAPTVSPDTLLFRQHKADDSFRIVIQGGSTAAGFPFGRFAAPTGMLQTRLKRLYPEKDIEIISTAMASVNSYALLDMVKEIIEIQPDLVMIYAGHNEYLGVMGVGSVYAGKGGRGANLLYLKLKEIRIFQLLQQGYYAIFSPSETETISQATGKSHTLMAKVAKEKNIPFNSPLYRSGIEQFAGNLKMILSQYQAAGIPVMLSTLAANEADQRPFSSSGDIDLGPLTQALAKGTINQAIAMGEALVQKNPNSADAHFYLAKSLQSANQTNQDNQAQRALKHFTLANDLDLLRFRAPSEFNTIIRKLAPNYGAILVDAQAFIRQNNQSGFIDGGVMYEHLHPNQRGYFLLAEAFVQQLVAGKYLADKANDVSSEQAWQDIPLSEVDRIYGDFKIKKLTSDYPFTETPAATNIQFQSSGTFESTTAEKRIRGEAWLSIQQRLLSHYQKQHKLPEAAKIAGVLFDALPHRGQIASVAALLYRDIQDFGMAVYYARKASGLEPQNLSYKMTLAQLYYRNQQLNKAITILQQVLSIEPSHQKAKFYLTQLSQSVGKD